MLGRDTPHLNRIVRDGFMCPLEGVAPAVTCTAQSSMLTGLPASGHGVVANGWYFRDLAEVFFWRQSNSLVQGEKVWEQAKKRKADFRCSVLFWWHNMYSSADHSVTLRPIYPADGRKIPALYSHPQGLHERLEEHLGGFPYFHFWGPGSNIKSSEWIARAAMLEFEWNRPDLQFVYLPHLDYNLQRLGPKDPAISGDIREIDRVVGALAEHVRARGAEVMIVSEYGIESVNRPVHINKILREHGYLSVRKTLGWELLDCGASRAFAVADHQVAHVYVRNPNDIADVTRVLQSTPGVGLVLGEEGKKHWQLDHARSGELVAVAEAGAWFTYYYWFDDKNAPDFARTVDIHRKPGYDPAELFVDPDLLFPLAKIAFNRSKKMLGFRMLMDVIPLKPELVRGSHGRPAAGIDAGPLLISSSPEFAADRYLMTDVKDLILRSVFARQ